MVLADPPFEIDVTEQRPRPLIPAPHPSPPPKRNTTESHHDSAGQGLFQRPASANPSLFVPNERSKLMSTFTTPSASSRQCRARRAPFQCIPSPARGRGRRRGGSAT